MTFLTGGDVIWVPYPHIDDNRRRPRPALVVASGLGHEGALLWALMITNAERPDWPGDVRIDDHESAGLPIPSKVRTDKIATLEAATANFVGRLPAGTLNKVRAVLASRVSAAAQSDSRS